ncbi:MAG: hypothetical protein EU541_07985 [Promethearchaeota archaeon]|nr:MAG: hypothetical protein EU541_07985 [Candidatus Lokiarchaeota archaeon]
MSTESNRQPLKDKISNREELKRSEIWFQKHSNTDILFSPSVLAKLFVPYSHLIGKKKMSSIKPSTNPKLSEEHIEILKKELGIIELDDKEGGNHKEK